MIDADEPQARLPRAAEEPAPATTSAIYVYPGGLYVATEPTEVLTILGTCVAVCLWDETARVGGINHYLLPVSRHYAERSNRFAEHATEALLAQVESRGARRPRLLAKVFGGMQSKLAPAQARKIGEENASIAFELLARFGIRVVASDVGGPRGRKLIFRTGNGDAWIKYL